MPLKRPIRRRAFLASAAGGVAAARAAPSLLASLRAPEPLVFGVLGCGGRGSDHVEDIARRARNPEHRISLAAVCDVYRPRLERAQRISGARGYADYREVLERRDINCVVIATPDHWHARMCIDALRAGKDVYCEKPWTRTAEEARDCYRAVRAAGRICQIGTQHTADGAYWAARGAVREGHLGKIVWSQTSYSRNSRDGEWNDRIDEQASPRNLDWDAFLGSAPRKPFDREHFFRFRKYWDYSGGIATDLHFHKLAPLLLALGPEFPRRVTAGGGIWVHKDEGQASPREVPDTFATIIDFPGEHTIVIASSLANASGLPDVIRGHQATLYFTGGGIEIRAEQIYRQEFAERHGGRHVVALPARHRGDWGFPGFPAHMSNFIHCVRVRREEDLNCGPELGYRTQVCISLSVDAYRRREVLAWDAEKEEVTQG